MRIEIGSSPMQQHSNVWIREKKCSCVDYYRVPIIAATIVVLVSIIMLRLGRNDLPMW